MCQHFFLGITLQLTTFKNNAACICDMQHLQGTRWSFVEVIKLLEVELKLLH